MVINNHYTTWANEALFIAGRQVCEAVCMVRAFVLVAFVLVAKGQREERGREGGREKGTVGDQRAAPRSLVANFTVVIAAASSEPEDGYERLVAGVYQRKHVASYQREDIPVELVIHKREP